MASTAANATEDQNQPNWPELKYGNGDCKRCRELDKLKLKPKPDDHDYIYQSDDFEGDEELMLRVIHYRRTCELTGNFNVDCPPSPEYAYIYNREHYYLSEGDLDKKVKRAVKFVIDAYNQQKGQNLILLGIKNVNIQQPGCYYVFFVTFESFNQSHYKSTDNSFVQIYQTVISYACWRWRSPNYTIHILRKSNSKGKDEDLLPPDSRYEERTRVKKELMWTLD
ncbi:unnamed protein product [Linum trigynum]|uniref:Cystatin domain-containing protein n=1 Tax=Linum trigynum TaxID=586398 RepID=A0AAV2G043_9ROSI